MICNDENMEAYYVTEVKKMHLFYIIDKHFSVFSQNIYFFSFIGFLSVVDVDVRITRKSR